MSDFENVVFPHIRYMSGPDAKSAKIGLFYMGGEPDENSVLIVGKSYDLSNHWFAPDRETKRKYVWSVKQDNKYYNVSPKNFGTIADLRDRRINQILD
jgi:hypothetical protein